MPAPIVHFEIGCQDAPKTAKFYSSLLGWKMQMFGDTHMTEAGMPQGIGGHIHSLGHPPNNYITIYAQVDDLDAYIRKAEALGGKRIVPPTEVPGMGHFAWISDPEGTIFGLWKPMAK
jgi:predicted enzyme related to lactoylglutathione lyase